MLPGYNTDINHRGRTYHVQTEDTGREDALIETLVFEGGRILDAHRYSYETLSHDEYDPTKITKVMEQQHREMIKLVKTGTFDPDKRQSSAAVSDSADSGYDDQILEILSEAENTDSLRLRFTEQPLFTAGRRHIFTLRAQDKETAVPVPHVAVKVNLVSTFSKPQELWEGKTGEDGEVNVECTIPSFTTAHAAVIIRASSEHGNDRLEQLVKKS